MRLSQDRTGEGKSTREQAAECSALAARLGWTVVQTYEDNDISAASGAPRPAYRAMLDAIRAGHIDGLIAWHNDRLHRRPVELEEFIAVVESRDVRIQTVTGGDRDLDLSTPNGRMVARMLGAAANYEVEHLRERVTAKKRLRAQEGRFLGGGRPFGFDYDSDSKVMTLNESEAALIREATHAVLAGQSMRSIAREWNALGIRTPERTYPVTDEDGNPVYDADGKPQREVITQEWSGRRVRDVLTRPRNAALVGSGRVTRGKGGIVEGAKAAHPAIVDEETWRALYAMLGDSDRLLHQGTNVKHLGSTLYRCGKCGGPMRRAPYKRKGGEAYHYRCEDNAHLTIVAEKTDAYVRALVAEYISDERVIRAMTMDDPQLAADRVRRDVLVARQAGFERDYSEGLIDGAQFKRVTDRTRAELEEVETRMNLAVKRAQSLPIADAVNPGQAFLNADIDVQRAVLASLFHVQVLPSVDRSTKWSEKRLLITPIYEKEPDG